MPKTSPGHAIFVLGMHRSGTSACARLLNLGGGDLGRDDGLDTPAADNETGFWEAAAIRDVNDAILETFGGSWSAPAPFEPGWETASELDPLREQARDALDALWDAKDVEAGRCTRLVKDPRCSLTLPFWRPFFPSIDAIVCVRNPLAVARSIEARDRMPLREGVRLWTEYTAHALCNVEPRRTAVVRYDALVGDWARAYESIRKRLTRSALAAPSKIRKQVETFLREDLRHQEADEVGLAESDDASFAALALYRALVSPESSKNVGLQSIARLGERALREHYDPARRLLYSPQPGEGGRGRGAAADRDALKVLLGAERERARAEQASLSRDLVAARAQRDAVLLGQEALRTQLAEARQQLSAAEQASAALGERLTGRVSELEQEIAGERAARDESRRLGERQIADARGEVDALREDLSKSRADAETSRDAERETYEARLARLRDELEAAQREKVEFARDAANRERAREAEQREALTALQTRLASEAAERASTLQAAIETANVEREAAVREANERVRSAIERRSAAESEIRTLRERFEALNPQKLALEVRAADLEARNDVLEGDLLVARNERDLAGEAQLQMRAELDAVREEQARAEADNASFQEQIAAERDLVARTEAQRDALQATLDEVESARTQLAARLTATEERITDLRARHDEQIAGHQAQRDRERAQWQALFEQEQARHHENTQANIERVSAEYERQVAEFRTSADELFERATRLEETLVDRDDRIAALQATAVLHQANHRDELERLSNEFDRVAKDLNQTTVRAEHFERRMHEALRDVARLRKRKGDLSREANDAKVALSALQLDHARTLDRYESLSHQYAEVQGTRDSLKLATRNTIWLFARRLYRSIPVPRRLRQGLRQGFYGLAGRLSPKSRRVQAYREAARVEASAANAVAVDASVFLETPTGGPRRADVFVFSVIDWHFRHQRPQHLALELAAQGHRVFYVATTFEHDVDDYHPTPEFVAPGVAVLRLPCPLPHPVIYRDAPDKEHVAQLLKGLEAIRERFAVPTAISIVNHPFWAPIVRQLPASRVVYDCMDHHAGFANTSDAVMEGEAALLRDADLVVVTAKLLEERAAPVARNMVRIPNAGEFDHFGTAAGIPTARERGGRPVVGYFGAIAEWFDMELVAAAAEAMPEADFVLIGSTIGANLAPTEGVPNIEFVGEIPYLELPDRLARFDVCLIPFQVNELTLSTNPVKVFEYLAAGKPVVSVRLPEVEPMEDVVELASTHDEFIEKVRAALEPVSPDVIEARRAFARDNTWAKRGALLAERIGALTPRVSVVVLTYNQLEFTQACLHSLESFTDYPDWELIIVDNASADGTPEFLEAFARERAHVTVILNDENRGFAGGNNVGAEAATGDVLVFLNNDTFVTRGWLPDLVAHLTEDPEIGLVGPVTNNIGNEARLDVHYEDMDQMAHLAAERALTHRHQRFEFRAAAFFCVAVPAALWREIGGLDEGFELGFFEDDDYANRVRQAGYRVMCAEDTFVHHHLSASFNALGAERKQELFLKNQAYYESKWGP
ncbi:MAG: glycosyltransferase, partial [Myxococcota bacterium]